jgi:hypothetical protein
MDNKISYDRQIDIFDPKNMKEEISIIGCGSVGSFTALALSKMGAKVSHLYDDDSIELHNLSNQFFKLSDLNKKKNVALKNLLKDFSDNDNVSLYGNVDNRTIFKTKIVVSAVDSMHARQLIWSRIKGSNVELYIDSRMGGKVYSIFTVDMSNQKSIDRYEKSLVNDDEVNPIRCTERTIIFNVLGVASSVCNQVVNWYKNNFDSEVHFSYEGFSSVVVE